MKAQLASGGYQEQWTAIGLSYCCSWATHTPCPAGQDPNQNSRLDILEETALGVGRRGFDAYGENSI
jgi:hypothetical protein